MQKDTQYHCNGTQGINSMDTLACIHPFLQISSLFFKFFFRKIEAIKIHFIRKVSNPFNCLQVAYNLLPALIIFRRNFNRPYSLAHFIEMGNKLFKFALYCHRLGFWSALTIIFKMFAGKKGKLISLHVPGISHPVYIRNQVYDQSTFQQIFVNREYDFEFEGRPSRIIDAGANIGLAAVYFANRFPSARIVCIEPESENFQLLQKNIAQYPNVTAVQAGVWSRSAFLKIHDHGLGNWGFTVEECNAGEAGALKAVSIQDVMKQHKFDTVDIIKMDIEGSEKEVLEAGDHDQWLSVCGTLVIELHDRMKKGTSAALFRAMLPYEVQVEQVGENFLCRMLSPKKNYSDFSQTVTNPPVSL